MTKPRYMECGTPRMGEAITAAGKRSLVAQAGPLARYMEDATNVFAGIDCVLGLIDSSDMRLDTAEDDCEVDPCFTAAQRGERLGLARTAAKLMLYQAEHVSEWADKYMFPQEGKRHDG